MCASWCLLNSMNSVSCTFCFAFAICFVHLLSSNSGFPHYQLSFHSMVTLSEQEGFAATLLSAEALGLTKVSSYSRGGAAAIL